MSVTLRVKWFNACYIVPSQPVFDLVPKHTFPCHQLLLSERHQSPFVLSAWWSYLIMRHCTNQTSPFVFQSQSRTHTMLDAQVPRVNFLGVFTFVGERASCVTKSKDVTDAFTKFLRYSRLRYKQSPLRFLILQPVRVTSI